RHGDVPRPGVRADRVRGTAGRDERGEAAGTSTSEVRTGRQVGNTLDGFDAWVAGRAHTRLSRIAKTLSATVPTLPAGHFHGGEDPARSPATSPLRGRKAKWGAS